MLSSIVRALARKLGRPVSSLALLAGGLALLTASEGSQAPAAPNVTRVVLPETPGAHAIWGATGQDSRGNVWFGVASADTPDPSGHLFEYDPVRGLMTTRGDVNGQLRRLKLSRDPKEHQAKIHSRILEGPNGYLYFASMDEEGESESRLRLPTWGGHLWRMRIATGQWEHLAATPEALIAVARGGRYIYALGYWGHLLLQYDTTTGAVKTLRVGSVDAHISRNFLADDRGHAYVTRLSSTPSANGKRVIDVALVEFDAGMREVAATPMDTSAYIQGDDANGSHGIIGIQQMADRAMYFTTHRGHLFRVVPPALPSQAAAAVSALGPMHPEGPMYLPGLFTPDGGSRLSAVARHPSGWQWLDCRLAPSLSCTAWPLAIEGMSADIMERTLLYGSVTRDSSGGHYLVGVTPGPGYGDPIVARVVPRQ